LLPGFRAVGLAVPSRNRSAQDDIVFLNENGRKSHTRVAALSLTDQLSIVNN
jgi:hypothetical protein